MHRACVFATVTLISLAAVSSRAQSTVNLTVDANMDIYQAGGNTDGSDGIAPVVYSFPAGASQTISFPVVGGAWSCQRGSSKFGADGETSGYCLTTYGPTNIGSVGSLAGYGLTDFNGAVAGVFLENALPASAPSALRFYAANDSEGGYSTAFRTLSPKIGQVFFIGDGLTGTETGASQVFVVPSSATHLYLGYVSNCKSPNSSTPGCYSGNAGAINMTVLLQAYVNDWVEPTISAAPSVRIAPGLTHDEAMHATLLFGGSSPFVPGPVYNDTWIWRDGWKQLSPAHSPAGRGQPGMAYDPVTGTVVLFGGEDNSNNGVALGDTWTWDGATWTQQFPPVSPAARSGDGMMAFDPASGTVLLFGGGGSDNGDYGGTDYGDTWEWNGTAKTWTQVFPANSPSPRGTSITHDSQTGNVVLFGGANGGGDCCRVYYNDTWTWDGVNWTQQAPANSPSARSCQVLAYDARLGSVVMYGGTDDPSNAFNDTWGWNGVTWKQYNLATSPSSRYCSSMDYDPLTGGLLLFGGELSGDIATNQTWVLEPVAVR